MFEENEEGRHITSHLHRGGEVAMYMSHRGNPLVYTGKPDPEKTILTVENYPKWYEIYMITPKKRILPFDNSAWIIEWADHVPVPSSLGAVGPGYLWDPQSLEMIIGRYAREILAQTPAWAKVSEE